MLGVYAPSENNPYLGQPKKKGEIWASGFLNPSGCSFDAIRPTVLVCPDRGWVRALNSAVLRWLALAGPALRRV